MVFDNNQYDNKTVLWFAETAIQGGYRGTEFKYELVTRVLIQMLEFDRVENLKTMENLTIIRSKVRTHNHHNAHMAPSLRLKHMQEIMIREVSVFIIVTTLRQAQANLG